MKKAALAMLLLLMMTPFAACCEEDMTEVRELRDGFYNPFLSTANDPWIVQGDGCYYYCYSLAGLHIVRSRTLTGFDAAQLSPDNVKLVKTDYEQTEIWAPELHHYRDHWYIFYAADFQNDNTKHRMYVMKSVTDDPMGDWEPAVRLELPKDQWAIDGTFFEYRDGRIFLIWSGWKSHVEGTALWKQYLYITELQQGDPTKVTGTERVLVAEPVYEWETSSLPQNEGPAVLVSPDGTYWCMYAGNYSGSDRYVIGAVRLNGDPMDENAWEKLPEPILESDPEAGIYSPGHASFVKSPDGTEDWIIYHTAKYSGSGWTRNGRLQRILWKDGVPSVEGGLACNDVMQPMPSGEETDRFLLFAADGQLSEQAERTADGKVHLPRSKGSVSVRFVSDRAASCAVTVRYFASGIKDTSAIRVKVNGNSYGMSVTRGGEGQFVLSCLAARLQEGVNEITVSGNVELTVDSLIIDRDPY